MRSALICVFLTLIVRSQEVSQASSINEFSPTPIPLTEWNAEGRMRNFHEPESTEATGSQSRYWEDALRHSVYLTLVRDKIDQLIAQGEVISPDKKPEPYTPKDIDDHDLWEKIKTAIFERVREGEPDTYGDVTILAKGRLLENKGTYRFEEDDRNRQKCYNATCMSGVKAIWSVKRVRQRDSESTTGSPHYELTFSVISQPAKKQKKPYENPIRTFTVREKQEQQEELLHYHSLERFQMRPTRMVWFHKNIVPTPKYRRQSLDRIFSSLFFDDDEEPPQRHYGRPPPHAMPVYNQYSKVAHVGSPSDQLQQKKPPQPPYKLRTKIMKVHSSGQLHQPIYNPESLPSPYPSQSSEQRYVLPIQPVSTTKSNNLSTTPTSLPGPPNSTENKAIKENLLNSTTEFTPKPNEIITSPPRYSIYGRPKNPSMKVKYYPEHIRPPIYNAPPGVFVTMDKKPFKPMPPLKLIHGKPVKTLRPLDFRPSPQVLDIQFSEPDPFSDTAFRPITVNYDNNVTTEKTYYEHSTHEDHRPSFTIRKPPKKHENIKAEKTTTSAPEIITAHNEIQEIENPSWNILGALIKTTPMTVPITEKIQTTPKEEEFIITTTTTTTTTTQQPTTTPKKRTTTTAEPPETTTTRKPTKRTRPPPDFKNTERKEKKSKRRTTTKSPKTPDKVALKAEQDLVPQASSAATSSSKLQKDSSKKPLSTTTSSPTTKNSTIFKTTTDRNESAPFNILTTTMASTKRTNMTKLPSSKVTQAPDIPTTTISTVNTITTNTSATKVSPPHTATLSAIISTATPKPSALKNNKVTKSFTSKASQKASSKTTTTTESPTTEVTEPTNLASTTQPKSKNRFRQSTLMQKGTSVNHDKWSVIPTSIEKSKNILPISGTSAPRRKGSNFQGYVTSTPKNTDIDDEENHISSPYMSKSSTTQKSVTTTVTIQDGTLQHDELDNESSASTMYDQFQYPENDVEDVDDLEPLQSYDGQGGRGPNEFMYDVLPLQVPKSRELEQVTHSEQVVETFSLPKNKTKCKKKKSQNLTTTSEYETEEVITTTVTPSTTSTTTPTTTTSQLSTITVHDDSKNSTKMKIKERNPDIFETLFGFNLDEDFPLNETSEYSEIQEQQSEHKPKAREEEYERTLSNIEDKPRRQADESEYDIEDYEDDKKIILDEDDSPFDSEELKNLASSEQDDYPSLEDEERLSLLELIGMH